ncbi:FecR domain-containing protein [Sorangium sp. So ce542]|uniref:FecR domain-containing protein n=1 Tax=Sorangium sp. So ce542 TaxID=3133316 RepID=UPI003F602643
MSGAKQYERAREHMERLLRAEEPPEPRWDEIERELFARIERPAPVRRAAPPQRSPLGRALAFAAAAAAIAFAVLAAGRSAPPVVATSTPPRARDLADVPRAAGAADDLDFRALRPGDAVETAAHAISFADVGSVRWTLLPNSRAVVRAVGAAGVGHVIALERGSVRADVVTRAPEEGLVEAFAVEVDGTRVAVHGTLFTVTRLADRVEVDVEHGTVAVGPAAYRGATTAHLLVGPSRGTFSLDGGREARLLQRPAPEGNAAPEGSAAPEDGAHAASPTEPARPPAPPRPTAGATAGVRSPSGAAAARVVVAQVEETAAASAAPAAPAVAEPPSAVAEPPPAPAIEPAPAAAAPVADAQAMPPPPALTPASVQSQLSSCFAREAAGGPSLVRKSIASTLRISVRPDGSVAAMRFDPPLRPALQACAQSLYQGRFAGGPMHLAIPFIIED